MLMRYGHQQLSEIERLTLDDILMWAEEIADMIKRENETGSQERD